MKLKDLKDKNGKRLLPEEKIYPDRYNFSSGVRAGYNQCLKELAEKDIRDYVEVDEFKVLDVFIDEFSKGLKVNKYVKGEFTYRVKKACLAIAKADILKSRR